MCVILVELYCLYGATFKSKKYFITSSSLTFSSSVTAATSANLFQPLDLVAFILGEEKIKIQQATQLSYRIPIRRVRSLRYSYTGH